MCIGHHLLVCIDKIISLFLVYKFVSNLARGFHTSQTEKSYFASKIQYSTGGSLPGNGIQLQVGIYKRKKVFFHFLYNF